MYSSNSLPTVSTIPVNITRVICSNCGSVHDYVGRETSDAMNQGSRSRGRRKIGRGSQFPQHPRFSLFHHSQALYIAGAIASQKMFPKLSRSFPVQRSLNALICSTCRGLATAAAPAPTLPLAGIRVLDMTRVLAGVSLVIAMPVPEACQTFQTALLYTNTRRSWVGTAIFSRLHPSLCKEADNAQYSDFDCHSEPKSLRSSILRGVTILEHGVRRMQNISKEGRRIALEKVHTSYRYFLSKPS